jgi:uncharacterized protein (TIGR02680 family)
MTDGVDQREPPTRWQLNRAGIVNVYQYENETIDFAGGRLLLRGVNGSGKSTAMNMLLPFLLTARVRGIDAAGEQTGVLRSWMLSGRDEAQPIGYLWIEFARRTESEPDISAEMEHLVIGCGIKANRATDNVSTWWFATAQRPGVDIDLVEAGVPLSADALRLAIDPDPVFAQDRRTDYRREVSRRLYGGADIDQFLDLLNTVRNPRVGDRVDVELPEHLVASLPGLSEEALTEAARPLDDLDEHRRNVADLQATAEGLDAIGAVYKRYVLTEIAAAADRGRGVLAEADTAGLTEQVARSAEVDGAAAEDAAAATVERLEADIARWASEISALEQSDAYTEGRQLDDLRTHVAELRRSLDAEESRARDLAVRIPIAEDKVRSQQARTGDDLSALAGDLAVLDLACVETALSIRPPVAPSIVRVPAGAANLYRPESSVDIEPLRSALDALSGAAGLRRADTQQVRTARGAVDHEAFELRAAEAAQGIAQAALADTVERFGETRRTLTAGHNEYDGALADWSSIAAAHFAARAFAAPAAWGEDRDRHRRRSELLEHVGRLVDIEQRNIIEAEQEQSGASAVVEDARAIRDELVARTEPETPSPPWQERTGAVLAELVDFADDVSADERAGFEAGLIAAGLLSASVNASGVSLATGELVAFASDARADAPLGARLSITSIDTGEREVVQQLLDSISTDPTSAATTVIASTGEFRLGTLAGRHDKEIAEFVGAGARRATLERRREAAVTALAVAEADLARLTAAVEDARASREATVELRDRLPDLVAIDAAQAAAAAAEDQLEQSRQRVKFCGELVSDTDRRLAAATDELDRIARSLQLPTDAGALDDVDRQLDSIVDQSRAAKAVARAVARSHVEWSDSAEGLDTLRADHAAAEHRTASTKSDFDARSARLATLEDTLGIAYEEVVEALQVARRDHVESTDQVPAARRAHADAIRANEAAANAVVTASAARQAADVACAAAHGGLVDLLAVDGLVAIARRPDDEAVAWSTASADPDGLRSLLTTITQHFEAPEGRGTTADGVRMSLRARRDSLGAGWDAEDRQPDVERALSVTVNGPLGQMSLANATEAVAHQLGVLTSLLTQKQDQALRELLQGLVAREVAEKMHRASGLVALMNERLATVTTAHGIGVKLRWRKSSELDDATKSAVAILAKLPDLRSEDEENQLRTSLAARLDEARRIEPDASYRHLIAQVFDYRRWHDMDVLVRREGDEERRLTRKTGLSEGEKKLVTYLPLFAAAAASCDALDGAGATSGVPRFVLLDDAFAKVSEDNHAKLFGLLVDLDLDFIATSERLWGTHDTVPALAITEVVRDAELGVILLEHARWNGTILAAGGAS